MIRIHYILWGADIEKDALAVLVASPRRDMPLAYVVMPTPDGSPRLYQNVAVSPDAVIVLLESAPVSGREAETVAARIADRASQCAITTAEMWDMLARIYRCYTLIDLGPQTNVNEAYRRVLGTEFYAGEMGAGTQYVAMTLRKQDAVGDPHGAVIPREKHEHLAQILIPLSGSARGYVELLEFGRLVPLIPGESIVRIPPNVTHTVYLNYGTTDTDSMHLLSIYSTAQHGEHVLQRERPMEEETR